MNKIVIKKKEDMNQKVFQQIQDHVPTSIKNELFYQIDPQSNQRDNNQKSEKDFQIIEQCLGSGAYGSVQLVRDVNSRIYYARKAISKSKLNEQESIDNLKREISIQKQLCHPNILKLCYCYEDQLSVLLILEYAELGSLFSLIKRKQRLQGREAYIYFSQLLSGLEYMHKMKIVQYKNMKYHPYTEIQKYCSINIQNYFFGIEFKSQKAKFKYKYSQSQNAVIKGLNCIQLFFSFPSPIAFSQSLILYLLLVEWIIK